MKSSTSGNHQIPFNRPYLIGKEFEYMQEATRSGKLSGNGGFTQRCQEFFEKSYGLAKCFLTSSCTDALEMAALILDIQVGDEVIVPSFTFVSTANAFALRGAKLVFADSESDFPRLDASNLEPLITPKTKAIVVVHYGGVACEMDPIQQLCKKYGLVLIEDAAQAIHSYLGEKALGTFGHLATFSFHETKNIHAGEGGMLAINDSSLNSKAEIIWEKGTDRTAFFRGETNKYGWKSLGSSFLPSELTAAFLWAQLDRIDEIQQRRKAIWRDYFNFFSKAQLEPEVLDRRYLDQIQEALEENMPSNRSYTFQTRPGNYHLFYILLPTRQVRDSFIAELGRKGILAVFHYQSLHRSEFSEIHFPDQFHRKLPNSDRFSDCLVRLPLFYELPELVKEVFHCPQKP
ncbi:dTDP-4-amino-4,6-dideoxygalactose transaminase [Algoriphagus hitonicola]|uniref:dTDP-4-amino-4,6-dideoxygalactose transaminase n=1 Tax=Algoriphagus hitonicola TaxID=435880 RepID=A0A1I2XTB3_9BACT|nr:dTDP-4-amino-4,6-dideoxygalactose transaminase [Algoriphagus hitonicola]SFH16690.1 dTDP-4-amino-4,6-dideoxygalactose transaminase [Algoriphagus hitonicola]